jgi:hypothetical protein
MHQLYPEQGNRLKLLRQKGKKKWEGRGGKMKLTNRKHPK